MTIRIPWKRIEYGYVEWKDEEASIDTLRQMTHDDYEEIVNASIAAEDAYILMNGIEAPTGMVGAAVAHGAVQAPPMRNPASSQQNSEKCPECGADGVWKTTRTNKRVLECSNPNHKNDKGYAFAIRWA